MNARPRDDKDDAFTLTAHDGRGAFREGHAGEIRITSGDGATIVWIETNGDGVADMRIDLTGTIKLTAADFIL